MKNATFLSLSIHNLFQDSKGNYSITHEYRFLSRPNESDYDPLKNQLLGVR